MKRILAHVSEKLRVKTEKYLHHWPTVNLSSSTCRTFLFSLFTFHVLLASSQIVYSDYSDPDVCKGRDGGYWLTASSFQCAPGLPILYSEDLSHWQLVNYAIDAVPVPQGKVRHCTFENGTPQAGEGVPHGCGVWAPSIRLHGDTYYIFWGDPDYGVWMTKTRDPRGKWDAPVLVLAAKGVIDTTPLWDDDGRVYLVNGWAASRCGFNSVLTVRELSADGTRVIGQPVLVYDGQVEGNHTVEGPKFYKHDGMYYILAPAGGVEKGWQIALRSKHVYGPYESCKVYTESGIHQGGWVDDSFICFQECGAYGRVLHRVDVEWKDGWPMMSKSRLDKPTELRVSTSELQRYQWHANYRDTFGFPTSSGMRVYGYNLPEGYTNCWEVPNLFLKKLEGDVFSDTLHLTITATAEGHESGVIIMGRDYCRLSALFEDGRFHLRQITCKSADKAGKEQPATDLAVIPARLYKAGSRDNYECHLSVIVRCDKGGECSFSYSTDGKTFTSAPTRFKAREGKWIGAKYGIFSLSPEPVRKGWCEMTVQKVSQK